MLYMLTLAAAYPNMPESMAEGTPPTPEKPTGDRSILHYYYGTAWYDANIIKLL